MARRPVLGWSPVFRPEAGQAASERMGALLACVALTFGISWGLAWASTRVEPAALSEAVYTLCGFGPSLAAFALVLIRDGRPGLGRWVQRGRGRG